MLEPDWTRLSTTPLAGRQRDYPHLRAAALSGNPLLPARGGEEKSRHAFARKLNNTQVEVPVLHQSYDLAQLRAVQVFAHT